MRQIKKKKNFFEYGTAVQYYFFELPDLIIFRIRYFLLLDFSVGTNKLTPQTSIPSHPNLRPVLNFLIFKSILVGKMLYVNNTAHFYIGAYISS